jgi:hypothetical protein
MTVTSKTEKEANISQMPMMDEAHGIILFSAANGKTLDPVFETPSLRSLSSHSFKQG